MTNDELYIDFDQKFDKINSNLVQSLLPEEKDWWLNAATLELLKPSPLLEQLGLNSSQRRIDKYEELIKRKTLPAYTYNDGFRQFCILPSDYCKLESDASNIVYNCNGVDQKGITASVAMACVPFPEDDRGGPNFYENFRIWLNASTYVYIMSDRLESINTLDLKYVVINDVFDVLKDNEITNLEVYWEKYGNVYKPNNLIFVSTASTPPTSVSWGWAPATAEETYNFTTLNYFKRPTVTVKKNLFKPNRLTPNDRLHEIQEHAFGKTSHKSPVSRLRDGMIEVYTNSTFNITSVEVEYVRVPKKINYLINQGSELNSNMHPELVTLAVTLAFDSISRTNKSELFKQNSFNN